MVQALRKGATQLAYTLACVVILSASVFAQQDPPSRVARLNYTNGSVSMEPAGVDDWAPADVNRPFTTGDYLYTDQGAQAELHLDVAVMRMGPQTSFGFLNLDDRTVQLKMTEGDMYIRLRNSGSDQVFEVDTPNAAVTLLGDGIYRFRVDANGNMSFVVVRQGQAQITGGGQAFTLDSGNSATLSGTDQLAYDVEAAPGPDSFDNWCEQRDAHEAHLESARYLPPSVIGYEDLDDYGSWQNSPEYGQVWYPQNVDPGWAPYQSGHWSWIEPWGYTWVDSAPWGFAPFHYGRWAYVGNRWGWCPGPIAVGYRGPAIRPYYAPAMVAWFGGAHWGTGLAWGSALSLGWVALGYGEVYTPPYQCSRPYFNNVNIYNTRVVNNVNITNVYNNVYVNKQVYNQTFVNARAPHGVVAMQQSAFASGRPVRGAAVAVQPAQFARLQQQGVHVVAPPVAPTRQAALGGYTGSTAPRPQPQIQQRQVVARNTPPAPAPSFAARQGFLQQHAGQPLNYAALRQAVPAARPTTAVVRQAPAARPVQVHAGQHVGNVPAAAAAANRPGAAPQPESRPAPAQQPVQNGRPGQPVAAQNTRLGQPPQPAGQPVRSAPAAAAPAPGAHGTPPNLRQPNTQDTRSAERYGQPVNRAAPAVQPATPATRNQPASNQPVNRPPVNNQPANRPAPAPEPTNRPAPERNQPVERPAAPASEARPQEQARPAPEPRQQESRPAEPARPAAPSSRPEARPAPPAQQQHGTPPNRDTQQHPKDDKKTDH